MTQCSSPLYGYSLNNTCLRECPTGFYANNITRMCQADCLNRWYLYGDNTTAECVRECPKIPNLFTNPDTRTCEFFCTSGRFADNSTGDCVLNA